MKKFSAVFVLLLLALTAFSQTVTLTFTGRDANNQYLLMDRVIIENVSQGWQEIIYYPDTVFTMGGTGIADNAAIGDFGLKQNNPNPFTGTTYATLQTMDAGEVIMEMTDVNGRVVETWRAASLQMGTHQFRINVAAAGIYFLTARQNGQTSSIKMVNNGQGATNRIEYQNFVDARNNNNNVETWRAASLPKNNANGNSLENTSCLLVVASLPKNDAKNNAKGNFKGVATHPFSVGNDMIYTGYVTVNGTEYQSQMIHQNQFVSETFVLNFNVSAPTDLPTVTTDAATNVGAYTATCGGNVTSDGGASVTARGVCWSTSPNPTIADSHTTDGSGTGSFTSSIIGLTDTTTYYVRAYATNEAGTSYGNQVSFITEVNLDGQSCPGAATVTDYDNNTYNTVRIGNQCWMKQNLKTTHYADGTSISLGSSTSSNTAYRYYPNGNSSNVSTYGYLYNWSAVMGNSSSSSSNPSGVQGVCPTGWHVPSDAEWTQLENYVSSRSEYVCGSNSSYIAKALASTTGWNSDDVNCAIGNNPSANNATGFSAVPAGYSYGDYNSFGFYAYFWSATQSSSYNACCRYLGSFLAYVLRFDYNKNYGYSVRCLRNESSPSAVLPTVSTMAVSSITQNSATCGGNVTADGGTTVTARGVCWSTSPNPTIADSHTTDGSGTGSFISSITGLTDTTAYYVRAYATNETGTGYGNQLSFTMVVAPIDGQPCPGVATITDYDNNTYNTVQIGNQCWMKENLRTTHYADGTSISLGSSTSTTTAYRYYPANDSSNVSTYGYFYNWPAVMHNSSSSSSNPSGVQGVCPNGWHVPSDAEWTQLTDYVSGQSEYVCGSSNDNIAKALASTTGWNSSTNTCAVGNAPSSNNATGFSAVPAGSYYGNYGSFGYGVDFWSATQFDSSYVFFCSLIYNHAIMYGYIYSKDNGYSVRCVRD